jgi:branched-chain amino acid transport system ATP-binding protein
MMPMLECREVSVSYGGLLAVKPTSLHVERGQLVGLIGPNGAGKTTLIDAMTGFVRSAGAVVFGGQDLSGLRPHRRVQAGLGRTFQALELFDDLTVRENLLVAAEPTRWWSPFADAVRPSRRGEADVAAALRAVSAEQYAEALPSELPNGVRKLIAVARSLAARPSMILLDEPAAGLDSDESQLLGTELRQLVDGGLGMLLVDHDMGLVLSVCDYLYVLDFGVVIAEGTPAAVRNDERVIRAYLGSGIPT